MKTSNTATRGLPEWKQDIFPGFDRNCGGCHSATGTNPQAAQARLAFQYGPENGDPAEEVLYHRLRARNFIFPEIGALSSPAFWAAIGSRTDGRNNSIYSSAGSQFKANYVSCQDSGKDKDCGFQFYSGHAGACNISVTDAQWVYSFGDWIDNHAPRDTGTTASYIKDRFHPSIDGALSDPNCSISDHLRIGYWDDSGQLKKVEVMLNGVQVAVYSNISNGAKLMDLSSFGLNSSDTLSVKATDPADNTQSYEKSVQDLVLECMARSGYVPPPPTPSPSPTPTSTPNPSPTPGEQEIILSVNTTEPVLGGRLKFNVNTNLPNGDFVIVGTITNERGRSYIQAPWNVILPNFVSDFVTNRTLKLFRGRLENSPKIQITIPNGPSSQWLLGNTFRFVALVQSPEGTIASNPVSLQFQVGGGQNIINGGKPHRKHGKRFRKSRKRGVALIKAAKLSRKSIIK